MKLFPVLDPDPDPKHWKMENLLNIKVCLKNKAMLTYRARG